MNEVLKEILKTGYTKNLKGEPHKVIGQISEDEGRLIRQCMMEAKAIVSVEIGLAFGTSALYICETLRKTKRTKHYIIDPYQNFENSYGGIGLNNLKRAGFEDIVHFIEKPSHLGLAELESKEVLVDFAFIDGWHTFDHVMVDFFFVDRILRVGGTMILDDADWPAIEKVCSFISSNRAYEFIGATSQRSTLSETKLPNPDRRISNKLKTMIKKKTNSKTRHGAVAFRKIDNDIRNWDHFIDFE